MIIKYYNVFRIDKDSFDVMSVVSQAHNQAVWHIIADMAKRKCIMQTKMISLADNIGVKVFSSF